MSLSGRKWMLGFLILLVIGVLLVGVVNAQDTTEKIKNTFSKAGNKFKSMFGAYNAVVVNSIVLIAIALLLGMFVAPKEGAQKTGVYLGLAALAVILAWQLNANLNYAGKFLWQISLIRDFFHFKVLVNALIICVLAYLILFEWIFKEKLKSGAGKWLVGITIVVLALMIVKPKIDYNSGETYDTMQPPYVYLWQRENLAEYRFFFLGDSGCEMVTYKSEEAEKVETLKEESEEEETTAERKTEIEEAVKKIDEETRKEKFCYTEESVLEYIKAVKDGEEYKPTTKILHEEDEYRGFGILRGNHLIMLAFGFGLFWWTFKMFMKEEEMKKVNVIMAFILGLSIARGNWSMESFWTFVQYWSWLLLFFMFYKSFKGGRA